MRQIITVRNSVYSLGVAPSTVTTRIITFSLGDTYKHSFTTVTKVTARR